MQPAIIETATVIDKSSTGIITPDMVLEAIELARPTIEQLLEMPKATWGPKWIDFVLVIPGFYNPITTTIGTKTTWDPNWGEWKPEHGPNEGCFQHIACYKTDKCLQYKMSTREIIATIPWAFQKGDLMYIGGIYCGGGMAMSGSGATADADELAVKIMHRELQTLIDLKMLQWQIEDRRIV